MYFDFTLWALIQNLSCDNLSYCIYTHPANFIFTIRQYSGLNKSSACMFLWKWISLVKAFVCLECEVCVVSQFVSLCHGTDLRFKVNRLYEYTALYRAQIMNKCLGKKKNGRLKFIKSIVHKNNKKRRLCHSFLI